MGHGRDCDCDLCYYASHPRVDFATLCCCCGEEDDPSGPGPAINTGYCDTCRAAECPEQQAGTPCRGGHRAPVEVDMFRVRLAKERELTATKARLAATPAVDHPAYSETEAKS